MILQGSGVPWVNALGGGGGHGDDRWPMRGSEATEQGEGVEGGIPAPTVGPFSKIRVSKSHFKARFSRKLNVKFHDEEQNYYLLNIE